MRLIQNASATGIYPVIASSSMGDGGPWFDIYHHLPTLVLFRVDSAEESLLLLKRCCGERLSGNGDFLYASRGGLIPARGQAAYVRAEAVAKVVEYVREHYPCAPIESAMQAMTKKREKEWGEEENTLDPIYFRALKLVVESRRVSISILQRALQVGFSKAARIIEWMEERGYISEYGGSSSRKVYITEEEFFERYEARMQKITLEALGAAVETGKASIHFFQSRCKMSYQQAKKAIDWMEKSGYVSAYDGVYPRKVLLGKAQFDETFGES